MPVYIGIYKIPIAVAVIVVVGRRHRRRRSSASYANQAEKLACFRRVLIIQATTFCNEIRTRAVVTAGDKCFAYGCRRPFRPKKENRGHKLLLGYI